jgi:hypothetical protein
VRRLAEGKGLGSERERTSDRWVANVTGYASVLQKLNAQYVAPPEPAPEPAAAAEETATEFSQMGVMYKKRLKHKVLECSRSAILFRLLLLSFCLSLFIPVWRAYCR